MNRRHVIFFPDEWGRRRVVRPIKLKKKIGPCAWAWPNFFIKKIEKNAFVDFFSNKFWVYVLISL